MHEADDSTSRAQLEAAASVLLEAVICLRALMPQAEQRVKHVGR